MIFGTYNVKKIKILWQKFAKLYVCLPSNDLLGSVVPVAPVGMDRRLWSPIKGPGECCEFSERETN